MSDSEESNDPASLSEASHSGSSGTPFQPQFASQMQQWVPPFYQQPFQGRFRPWISSATPCSKICLL